MTLRISPQKRAELAGSTGAGILGFGLGSLLAKWSAPYAVALIVVGVVMHGWGMLEKHRWEAGMAVPLWSTVLYWLCWVVLAILMVGTLVAALQG